METNPVFKAVTIALSIPVMVLWVVGLVLNNPIVIGLGILAMIPTIWTIVRK